MLVLSRLPDQRLVIPQFGIVITIVDTRGDRVRLGIDADQSVAVFREEVWNKIRETDPVRAAEIMARGKPATGESKT